MARADLLAWAARVGWVGRVERARVAAGMERVGGLAEGQAKAGLVAAWEEGWVTAGLAAARVAGAAQEGDWATAVLEGGRAGRAAAAST